MNPTIVIIAVAASLAVLVATVFTLQQIEKSNREKQSLIAALRGRMRNFQHLLEGFPEGFLNRDLQLLVCHCLLDTLEQLARLEPKQHTAPLQAIQERMAQLQGQPQQDSYQPLTEPAQIHEVQKLLNSLANVLQRLAQSGRLPPAETARYGQQVRRLSSRTALDGHLAAAQSALQQEKPRLAEHHYRQAVDRMRKDNADGFYAAQIVNCERHIAELEKLQEPTGDAAADEAWREFASDDGTWQKKSLYDE
jgi:hypothetical protein